MHNKKGIRCIDCHKPQNFHFFPAGKGSDLAANDLRGVDIYCTSCHVSFHKGSLSEWENSPHKRMACESCHITKVVGAIWRDWTRKAPPGSPCPTYTEHLHEGAKPYEKMTFADEEKEGYALVYRWWAGKMKFVREDGKESYIPIFSNPEDPDAKLYSFKLVRGKDYDGKEFEMPVRVTHGITKSDVSICQVCHTREDVMKDIGVQTPVAKECRKDCLSCHKIGGELIKPKASIKSR